jgi:hypothetical protein
MGRANQVVKMGKLDYVMMPDGPADFQFDKEN